MLDAISSNMDRVLSINRSTNLIVFGHFNAYLKELLNLVRTIIFFNLKKTIRRLVAFLLGTLIGMLTVVHFVSLALVRQWLSIIRKSDHVVALVSIDFPLNSVGDTHRTLFHCSAFDIKF